LRLDFTCGLHHNWKNAVPQQLNQFNDCQPAPQTSFVSTESVPDTVEFNLSPEYSPVTLTTQLGVYRLRTVH